MSKRLFSHCIVLKRYRASDWFLTIQKTNSFFRDFRDRAAFLISTIYHFQQFTRPEIFFNKLRCPRDNNLIKAYLVPYQKPINIWTGDMFCNN